MAQWDLKPGECVQEEVAGPFDLWSQKSTFVCIEAGLPVDVRIRLHDKIGIDGAFIVLIYLAHSRRAQLPKHNPRARLRSSPDICSELRSSKSRRIASTALGIWVCPRQVWNDPSMRQCDPSLTTKGNCGLPLKGAKDISLLVYNFFLYILLSYFSRFHWCGIGWDIGGNGTERNGPKIHYSG